MFCLNNFPVWFVCLGSECIILMRLPGESGFFMDSISYYFFFWNYFYCQPLEFILSTLIFFILAVLHSVFRLYEAIFRSISHSGPCAAEIFSIYHKYFLCSAIPGLLAVPPCTPAPWVIPIAIVAAPRMSPKKMRCISTAGCHIANGIEQCNTDIGGNNNSGETQWNVCNAWDEMQHALRPKKNKNYKNGNWKSGERKAKTSDAKKKKRKKKTTHF